MRLNGVWFLLVASVLVVAGCDNGDAAEPSSSLPTTRVNAATTTSAASPPEVIAVTPTSAASPPEVITVTPTSAASLSGFAWSRVPDDDSVFGGADFAEMSDVTVGGPGLVAVGGAGSLDPIEQDAAVWISSDGFTWSRVADTDEVLGGPGLQGMNAVIAGGPGLVAVGSDGVKAGVWTSADGVNWSKMTIGDEAGAMSSVTAGGPGLVAVGGAGGFADGEAAVWTSPDGVTWSRVSHDEAVFGGTDNQIMLSVTAGGPGFVAVGQDGPVSEQDAAVWTSQDGIAWSRVPDNDDVLGGPGLQQMSGVAAGEMGLVAVGGQVVVTLETFKPEAAVWTSPDGLTWTRVASVADVFGYLLTSVTVAGNEFVAVGLDIRFIFSGGSHAPIWTSSDGITWSQETIDGEVGGLINGVAVGGPGLVAVGEHRDHAAVWTGTTRS